MPNQSLGHAGVPADTEKCAAMGYALAKEIVSIIGEGNERTIDLGMAGQIDKAYGVQRETGARIYFACVTAIHRALHSTEPPPTKEAKP